MDLPGLMFINEECGNFKVVVDGGELTRNNDRERKSKVLQAYICQLFDECCNEVSMIFLVVTLFVGR